LSLIGYSNIRKVLQEDFNAIKVIDLNLHSNIKSQFNQALIDRIFLILKTYKSLMSNQDNLSLIKEKTYIN